LNVGADYEQKGRGFLSVAAVILIPAIVLLSGLIVQKECFVESKTLGEWGEYLTGTATLVLACGAVVGLIQGLRDYRSKIDVEKAKWFLQLYEKFFEHNQYKAVRRRLDYDETDKINQLIAAASQGHKFSTDEQIEFDDFTDYLNFFELIALLKKTGQLTSDDIKAGFEYYLRLLTKGQNPVIRRYLVEAGFKNLDRLLEEYESQN
jgi:hypothetical protein